MSFPSGYIVLTLALVLSPLGVARSQEAPQPQADERAAKIAQLKESLFGITAASSKISSESPCFVAMYENSVSIFDPKWSVSQNLSYDANKAASRVTYMMCQAYAVLTVVEYTSEEAKSDFCNAEKFAAESKASHDQIADLEIRLAKLSPPQDEKNELEQFLKQTRLAAEQAPTLQKLACHQP